MVIASQAPPITEDVSGWLGSIGGHIFAVGSRVDIGKGFVGAYEPSQPCGAGLSGGSCQTLRWRRVLSTTRRSSMRAMTRIGSWKTGQRRGSTCQTRKMRSRHFFEGRLRGGGGERKVEDWMLSRYACYLVIQNADPSKPLVALGQSYFAIQTRRQELADAEASQENQKRLLLRAEWEGEPLINAHGALMGEGLCFYEYAIPDGIPEQEVTDAFLPISHP
jgi:hypothetical protein